MDVKKYISDFQILGNRVVKLRIKNDFVGLDDQESIKRKIDITHEILRIDKNEADELLGLVLLNLTVRIHNAEKHFQLDISMEGCFGAPSGTERDKFEKMLGINGVTALYSITRSAVLSISSQAFIKGSVLLPMINVLEYSKDITAAKNSLSTSNSYPCTHSKRV